MSDRAFKDANKLREQVDEYFTSISYYDKVKKANSDEYVTDDRNNEIFDLQFYKQPSLLGIMLHLGIYSKETYYKYRNGVYDDDKNKFSEVLEYAMLVIENTKAQRLYDGKNNVIGIIFDLKVNHKWDDGSNKNFNINIDNDKLLSLEDGELDKELRELEAKIK